MKILFSLCFYFFAVCSFAQTSIVWERTLGGSNDETAYSITPTFDGGTIVCIEALSDNGDVTNKGTYADFWIVKLSKDGNVQWQKSFEGNGYDVPFSIIETPDRGIVVAGTTHFINNNTINWTGNWDAWIIKLTKNGVLEWEKKFGAMDEDGALKIINTHDNGFCFVGSLSAKTASPNYNYDVWIVRLNEFGNFTWQKTFGGSADESLSSVKQTSDGGFIMCGYSSSANGTFGTGFGDYDGLVVKVDSVGEVQWYKRMGKNRKDILRDFVLLDNGNILLVGETEVNPEGSNPTYFVPHSWVVLMDSIGNVIWEKVYPSESISFEIKKFNDTSFIVSASKRKSREDCRIYRINDKGDVKWDVTFGGSEDDVPYSMYVQKSNEIFFAGYTSSNDGDVSNNKGGKDAWVVKLQVNDSLFTSVYEQFKLPIIMPNPSSTQFSITVDIESEDLYTVQLVSVDGSIVETVFSGIAPKGKKEIAVSNANLQNGTYFCVVRNTENVVTLKFQIVK